MVHPNGNSDEFLKAECGLIEELGVPGGLHSLPGFTSRNPSPLVLTVKNPCGCGRGEVYIELFSIKKKLAL